MRPLTYVMPPGRGVRWVLPPALAVCTLNSDSIIANMSGCAVGSLTQMTQHGLGASSTVSDRPQRMPEGLIRGQSSSI